MRDNPKLIAWSIMAYLALMWGSSFIIMNEALKVFSPEEVACLRILIAAVSFLPFALPHIRKIKKEEWLAIVLVGGLGNAIPAFLFPKSLEVITTATAGILNSLSPVFTLVLGAAFFGFRFKKSRSLGIVVGLLGASLLVLFKADKPNITPDTYSPLTYSLFALMAVMAAGCYGLSTNIIKRHLNTTRSWLVSSFALGSMALPALLYFVGLTDGPQKIAAGGEVWEALGYLFILAFFGTAVAVALFNRMIQLTDPIFSSSVTYLIPIVALGWGIVIGEEVGWQQIVGLLTILSGIYLVNRK
jgi:drug/metabolite transporter (DMT)-like permease